MREYTQARLDFIDKAIDGVYSPSQAKAELERLHQKYGDNVFLPDSIVRKPRPWTRADLKNLELEASAGAGSKDFLFYLAEVGNEVNRQERQKKRIKMVAIITVAVAAIAVVVAVARMLRG